MVLTHFLKFKKVGKEEWKPKLKNGEPETYIIYYSGTY